ncbi:MAG: hypothetical protein MJE77_34040 [Proteobacteria bacterium]|nr:hypothetical protein [Pseudomonadota bacterium]
MDRHPPRSTSDEIDLYVRTYYSLLRSTGEVQVRAFEEAHAFSQSSLHPGARDPKVDVAAFAYSAARLPVCMPSVTHIALGQSNEQFEQIGLPVREWQPVTTRGRRRPLRWDGGNRLAVFITSSSDIDDLVPIVTAYQIEWNKMHRSLAHCQAGEALAAGRDVDADAVRTALDFDERDYETLKSALGSEYLRALGQIAGRISARSVLLVNGTFLEYQRAANRWWSGIEPTYMGPARSRRPVFFVSSNTHSLANLLGGYALSHRDKLIEYARQTNPEGLAEPLNQAISRGDEATVSNISYYLLRQYLHDQSDAADRIFSTQRFDAESGITTVVSPGKIDVSAQLIELDKLRPERLDPRVRVPGVDRLASSDAVIINIDYPLGMSAYHHLSSLAQGVGEIRGVYIMGKAATLNGKVGDVMLSSAAYDEHSKNTFLFRNCFRASDVQRFVQLGTVLDNQKALTVRGSFLQNRDYMRVYHQVGYTVLEMEAGPYLAALYELMRPTRHPKDEVVHLSNEMPCDFGLLHYASDTPYSRRQSLLSKSLSYFGVDSTYGCSIAIVRQILGREILRLEG